MLRVLQWIDMHRPKTFLVENVAGLLLRHEQLLLQVVEFLVGLQDRHGQADYQVEVELLNARVHAGVPQHRERIFIIGCRRDCQQADMSWPQPKDMRPIDSYLLTDDQLHVLGVPFPMLPDSRQRTLRAGLERICSAGGDPEVERYVVNIGGSSPHYNLDYAPCLTRARAGDPCGMFLSWKMRCLCAYEAVQLQGVRLEEVVATSLSPRQLGNLAGNAIQVDLLALVLRSLLRMAGLL